MPDNTTFVTVTATAPAIKSGSYLLNANSSGVPATLGVYQQLSTRAGGEVIERRFLLTDPFARDSHRIDSVDRAVQNGCLSNPSGLPPGAIVFIWNDLR